MYKHLNVLKVMFIKQKNVISICLYLKLKIKNYVAIIQITVMFSFCFIDNLIIYQIL